MNDHDVPEYDDDDDEAMPVRRRAHHSQAHRHSCVNECGADLYCPPDHCTIKGAWMCPTCEDHIEELQLDVWADEEERRKRIP